MNFLMAAGALAPLFFEAAPEIRTTYQSLGKIVEDRPMQVMNIRAGFDTGLFGRFGIRNWDVSSLTDRRADAHRHAIYHTEFGPTWQYDWEIAEDWTLKNDLTRSWTIYRGFTDSSSDTTYHWYQLDQSLENPWIVPFGRFRRCFRGSDYIYGKFGVRRKFAFDCGFYATPSVFAEGGNSRNYRRVFGARREGDWPVGGVSSVSFRLECGWRINDNFSLFAFVEQYEVTGHTARKVNGGSSFSCAHNDWTHGGFGVRLKF